MELEINQIEFEDSDSLGFHVMKFSLGSPKNWNDLAEEVFEDRIFLWNELVSAYEQNTADYESMCRRFDSGLGSVESSLKQLQKKRDDLESERSRKRREFQGKTVESESNNEKIVAIYKEINAKISEISSRRKKASQEAKKEHAELSNQFKKTIQELTSKSSLWWPIAESVKNDFEKALAMVKKTNRKFREKEYEGLGSLALRIHGGVSAIDILNGKNPWISIDPVCDEAWADNSNESRKKRWTTLRVVFAVGKDQAGKKQRHSLEFPMMMHRPIDLSSHFTSLRLTKKKKATGSEWTVSMIFKGSQSRSKFDLDRHINKMSKEVSVDVGWKLVSEGIEVAYCVDLNGQETRLHLPLRWMDGQDRVRSLKSVLEQKLQDIRQALAPMKNAVDACGLSTLGKFHQWYYSTTGRFDEYYDFSNEVITKDHLKGKPFYAVVEQSHAAVKKVFEEQSNLARNLSNQRAQLYQQFAMRLASTHGRIYLEDFNLSLVQRKVDDEGREKSEKAAVRRYQRYADISLLRHWINHMGRKQGTHVIKVSSKDINKTCHHCKTVHETKPVDGIVTCPSCFTQYTRQRNACANMFMRGNNTGMNLIDARQPNEPLKRRGRPKKLKVEEKQCN